MIYYPLSALFIAFTSLLFFLFLLFQKTSYLRNTYLLFSFSAIAWSFPYFIWQMSTTYEAALFWSRALTAGSILMPPTFLHFIIKFVGYQKKKKWLIYFIYLYFGFFFLFSFSPLMVRTVEPALFFPFWPKPGILYHPFLTGFFSTFFYSFYLIFSLFRRSSGFKRMQAKIIFWGILFSYFCAATNFFLWYNIPIPPIANIGTCVFVAVIGYAIVRLRFMDIRLALRQSTVYLLSVLTVLAPILFISSFTSRIYPNYLFWVDAIMVIFAVSVFSSIRNYYYRLANKYFFSSLYDAGQTISELSDKLRSTIEAEKIYYCLTQTLLKSLHVRTINVYTFNKKAKIYNLKHSYNSLGTEKDKLIYNHHIEDNYFKKNIPLVTEELEQADASREYKNYLNDLEKMNIEVLVPLSIKEQTIGLIALGPKESGDTYKENDLDFLEIIATQVAFALNNAILYERAQNLNLRLKEEKNKTAAIIANLVDPILVLDKKGNLILFNDSASQVLKLEQGDLFKNIERHNNYSLENFRGLFKVDYEVKELKEGGGGKARMEEIVIKPKGGSKKEKESPFRTSITTYNKDEQVYKVLTAPIHDKQGRLYGHMKIFYDLTRERLVDMLKSEFISIAAHQLRTPLSAVKWAIKIMLDGDAGKLNPQQQDLLQKGYVNNERVIKLINDMLHVSRIEEGKFGYSYTTENFLTLIDQIVERLEPRIESKKIKFQLRKPGYPIITNIDMEKMEIALEHLLENAVEYTPEGGAVECEISTDNNTYTVRIKDKGVGIPVGEQTKMFQKFFRAENVVRMQTEGSGLGLYIAKNVIEKHGGEISFKSAENEGTEFTITLPIRNET